MHSDAIQQIARVHAGDMPSSWGTGDEKFQKAKVIAAIAWHQVRPLGDPELPACDLTFQETCVAEVEGVLDGNPPNPTPFGAAVFALVTEINKAAKAAATTNMTTEET